MSSRRPAQARTDRGELCATATWWSPATPDDAALEALRAVPDPGLDLSPETFFTVAMKLCLTWRSGNVTAIPAVTKPLSKE